jgi:hypothetical protein
MPSANRKPRSMIGIEASSKGRKEPLTKTMLDMRSLLRKPRRLYARAS